MQLFRCPRLRTPKYDTGRHKGVFTLFAGGRFWLYLEVTGVFRHALQLYDVLLGYLVLFSQVIFPCFLSDVCNSKLLMGGLYHILPKFDQIYVAVLTFSPFFCAVTFITTLLLIVCALR